MNIVLNRIGMISAEKTLLKTFASVSAIGDGEAKVFFSMDKWLTKKWKYGNYLHMNRLQ
jgi:hypothetical protein